MSTIDAPNARPEIIGPADIDPWRVIMKVASQDEEGLSRSLRWLCLLAQSGIDIPVAIYLQFSTLAEQFDASLTDSALLAKCGLFSAWQKGIGRQDLQKMFSALHVRLMSQVVDSLQSSQSQIDVYVSFSLIDVAPLMTALQVSLHQTFFGSLSLDLWF